MIDILRFFQDNNIEHWTSGKNVADGFINTKCCFCDDKSNHLGFTYNGNTCICWKCGKHKVFDALCLLTDKSRKEVARSLENYKDMQSGYEVEYEKKEYKNETIEVPGTKLLRGHDLYLTNRGFDAEYIKNKYDLRATLIYKDYLYSYRIIVPIYYNHRIISYIARDFTGKQERYMLCKPENEILFHKNVLFNLDNCKLNRCLVVEGVFDVMNIGDNCCATFGCKWIPEQLALLRKRFDLIYVMYDDDVKAQISAIKLCKEFTLLGGKAVNICLDEGDGGDMSVEDKKILKKDLNI